MKLRAPGYWPHETSGRLAPVVKAYLAGEPLDADQLATLRAYFRQWIGASLWDENPTASLADRAELGVLRETVDDLTTRQAIDDWLDRVVAFGLDPL